MAAIHVDPNWLTAIGGVGAFLGTLVLAFLAWRQMRAAVEQVEATREIASQAVYPLVYGHQRHAVNYEAEGDVFVFHYYLWNEGLGPALDVEHGVLIAGEEVAFGDDWQFRSIQPGEFIPPREDDADGVPSRSLDLPVPKGRYYGSGHAAADRVPPEQVYWCRYRDLFGRRWETRNSTNASRRPEIRRLADSVAVHIKAEQ